MNNFPKNFLTISKAFYVHPGPWNPDTSPDPNLDTNAEPNQHTDPDPNPDTNQDPNPDTNPDPINTKPDPLQNPRRVLIRFRKWGLFVWHS